MKTYEVELKHTSYTIYTVEADSVEEAEDKAWKQLENDHTQKYGNWEVESIEEGEEA